MTARFLSTRAVARLLSVTTKYVAQNCAAGRVEGARKLSDSPRAQWRIPEDSPFLEGRKVPAKYTPAPDATLPELVAAFEREMRDPAARQQFITQ